MNKWWDPLIGKTLLYYMVVAMILRLCYFSGSKLELAPITKNLVGRRRGETNIGRYFAVVDERWGFLPSHNHKTTTHPTTSKGAQKVPSYCEIFRISFFKSQMRRYDKWIWYIFINLYLVFVTFVISCSLASETVIEENLTRLGCLCMKTMRPFSQTSESVIEGVLPTESCPSREPRERETSESISIPVWWREAIIINLVLRVFLRQKLTTTTLSTSKPSIFAR